MSKHELIFQIQQHNPTAAQDFLAAFDETALHRYLSHLRYQGTPRANCQIWVRRPETAALMTRQYA